MSFKNPGKSMALKIPAWNFQRAESERGDFRFPYKVSRLRRLILAAHPCATRNLPGQRFLSHLKIHTQLARLFPLHPELAGIQWLHAASRISQGIKGLMKPLCQQIGVLAGAAHTHAPF
jgi:hypothetical protein